MARVLPGRHKIHPYTLEECSKIGTVDEFN